MTTAWEDKGLGLYFPSAERLSLNDDKSAATLVSRLQDSTPSTFVFLVASTSAALFYSTNTPHRATVASQACDTAHIADASPPTSFSTPVSIGTLREVVIDLNGGHGCHIPLCHDARLLALIPSPVGVRGSVLRCINSRPYLGHSADPGEILIQKLEIMWPIVEYEANTAIGIKEKNIQKNPKIPITFDYWQFLEKEVPTVTTVFNFDIKDQFNNLQFDMPNFEIVGFQNKRKNRADQGKHTSMFDHCNTPSKVKDLGGVELSDGLTIEQVHMPRVTVINSTVALGTHILLHWAMHQGQTTTQITVETPDVKNDVLQKGRALPTASKTPSSSVGVFTDRMCLLSSLPAMNQCLEAVGEVDGAFGGRDDDVEETSLRTDIHGDSLPFLLQPLDELSNGFWPRLTSPHPAIQFVPKMFYRVEVGALGGPAQLANIVVGVPLHSSP
ncbi:hypothetical protein PR048_008400 [Dryococelus australis]|uniref:Uncharacterized protein n=1 Tax=Dryococelus australis TaxID=614101 RepID=A0ABQ9HXT7_9NEOP|nr:hypothetical protein PR048_008400 [Dryococelus australis]